MNGKRLLSLLLSLLLLASLLLTAGCGGDEPPADEPAIGSSDGTMEGETTTTSVSDVSDDSTAASTVTEGGDSSTADSVSTENTAVSATGSHGTTAKPSGESTAAVKTTKPAATTAQKTTVKPTKVSTKPSVSTKPTERPADLIPITTNKSTTAVNKPTDPVKQFLSGYEELVNTMTEFKMKKIKSVTLKDGTVLDSYSLTSSAYVSRYCLHVQYQKGKKVILANVTVAEERYDFMFTVFAYYLCYCLNLETPDADILFDQLGGLPTVNDFKTMTSGGYQLTCYFPAEFIGFTAAAVGQSVASPQALETRLTAAQCTECFGNPNRSVNYMKLTDNGKALGLTDRILSRALVNAGNQARLAKAMNKAKAGEGLTFAAIGGSVTEGAYASDYSTQSYAGLTNGWFKKTFPKSSVKFVHTGIGGTSSLLGVHRLEQDVLCHNPDVVVIEYAVNDTSNRYQREAYAALVRRVLEHKSQPAVILLFIMDEQGNNVQKEQIPVGEHYDLPMISHRNAIWPEVKTAANPDGQYAWSEIGADWVHPTNRGHALIAELLCSYLQKTYEKLATLSTTVPALPAPYLGDGFENATWYHRSNITPKSLGSFTSYNSDGCSWKSNGKQPIVFEVTGKRIFIPTSASRGENFDVTVRIDGGAPIKLDVNTKEFGGGRYINYLVLDEKVSAKHTVEITCNSGTLYLGGLFVS